MFRILSIIFSTIILKKTKSDDWFQPYVIYETGYTYPRPLLIEKANGDVLALSSAKDDTIGDGHGTMARYNKEGEFLWQKSLKFHYHENVCVREIDDNSYIAASSIKNDSEGACNKLELAYFNDDGVKFITELPLTPQSGFCVSSFKIDIFIDHNRNPIISFSNKANKIYVNRYFIGYDSFSIEQKKIVIIMISHMSLQLLEKIVIFLVWK